MELRKNNYVLCKYRGDNGDLIAGRVVSVRRNGEVVLENLLTGHRSLKSIKVLEKRNVKVTKKAASRVLRAFQQMGKAAARLEAVLVAESFVDEADEGKVVLVSVRVLRSKGNYCHKDCTWEVDGWCSLCEEWLEESGNKVHPWKPAESCMKEEV